MPKVIRWCRAGLEPKSWPWGVAPSSFHWLAPCELSSGAADEDLSLRSSWGLVLLSLATPSLGCSVPELSPFYLSPERLEDAPALGTGKGWDSLQGAQTLEPKASHRAWQPVNPLSCGTAVRYLGAVGGGRRAQP